MSAQTASPDFARLMAKRPTHDQPLREWVRANMDPTTIPAPPEVGTYRVPFYPVANGQRLTVHVLVKFDGTAWSWA